MQPPQDAGSLPKGDVSDQDLLKIIIEADEEALLEGSSPKQRSMTVIPKVMRRLGYTTSVLAGSSTPPIVQKISALHGSLYRGSDLAIGGIHGGIFMFRDVFARISIPLGYGRMVLDPFKLTDLSEMQLRWLASRPADMEIFTDQFVDIFDLAGGVRNLGDYKMPPKEALEIFWLAAFQFQAAAAALSVAFDFRGAVQSAIIGTELALKAGLAAKGASEQARRKHGHDLQSAAKAYAAESRAFDLNRVLETLERIPRYVENRYSPVQPGRVETGHIVMGAQYVAGEVMRQVTEYSVRSALNPPAKRVYP